MGSAGRAGLNPSFQNLPEKQKRTRANALLVSPCCRAGATPHDAVGFSFLGIPVCLILLVSSHCSGIYQEGGVSSCDSKTTRVVSS